MLDIEPDFSDELWEGARNAIIEGEWNLRERGLGMDLHIGRARDNRCGFSCPSG